MSFEQLAAISAKVAERTREDGSSIGNAMKTIITRISKVNKMPQYADEVSNEELSKASESLHSIGVEVYKSNGEMNDMITILTNLREKWDGLSDAQQANIAFNIAATRQTSKFKNILEAWTDSMTLADQATEASGNALANQEKYQESMTGKLQSLRTEMDAFWIEFYNQKATKGVVQFLIDFVKGLSNLGKNIGHLQTVVLLLTALVALKNKGKVLDGILTIFSNPGAVFGIAAIGAAIAGVITLYQRFSNDTGNLIKRNKELIESQQKVAEAHKESIRENESNASSLKDLLESYEQAEVGSEQYYNIRNQIAEQFPELVLGYDSEGQAIIAGTEAIRNRIQAYHDMAIAERIAMKNDADENINDVLGGQRYTGTLKFTGKNGIRDLVDKRKELQQSIEEASNAIYDPTSEYYRNKLHALNAKESAIHFGITQGIGSRVPEEIQKDIDSYGEQIKELDDYLISTRTYLKSQYALLAGDTSELTSEQSDALNALEDIMSHYGAYAGEFNDKWRELRNKSSEEQEAFAQQINDLLNPDLSSITALDYRTIMRGRYATLSAQLGLTPDQKEFLGYQLNIDTVQNSLEEQLNSIVSNLDYNAIANNLGINFKEVISSLSVADLDLFESGRFFSNEAKKRLEEQFGSAVEDIKKSKLLDLQSVDWDKKTVTKSTQEGFELYQKAIERAKAKNIDINRTQFGNIDLANRQILKNDDGSISTVLGTSAEFDGLEIAFSPILQTDKGPLLLNDDTVNTYIGELLHKVSESKDQWSTEDLLQLDTEGLDIDAQHIQGLLADVGETARETAKNMHLIEEVHYSKVNTGSDFVDNPDDYLTYSESTIKGLATAIQNYGIADSIQAAIDLMVEWGWVTDNTAEGIKKSFDTFKQSMESNIQTLNQSASSLNSSMAEMSKNGGIQKETYDSLLASNKDYADSLFVTSQGMQINVTRAKKVQQAERKLLRQDLDKKYKELSDEFDKNQDEINKLNAEYAEMIKSTDGLSTATEQARQQKMNEINSYYLAQQAIQGNISSLQNLRAELGFSTSAYADWQNAINNGSYGDQYNTITSWVDTYKDMFEKGWVGNESFEAFTTMFTGIEDFGIGGADNYAEMVLDFAEKYFTEDDSGPLKMRETMEKALREAANENEEYKSWIDEEGNLSIQNPQEMANILTNYIRKHFGEQYSEFLMTGELYEIIAASLTEAGLGDFLKSTPKEGLGTADELSASLKRLQEEQAGLELEDGTILDPVRWEELQKEIERTEQDLYALKISTASITTNDDLDETVKTIKEAFGEESEVEIPELQLKYASVQKAEEDIEKLQEAKDELYEKNTQEDGSILDISEWSETDQAALEAISVGISHVLEQKHELETPWIMSVDTSSLEDSNLAVFVQKLQEYHTAVEEYDTAKTQFGFNSEEANQALEKVTSLREQVELLNAESNGELGTTLGIDFTYQEGTLAEQLANITKFANKEESNKFTIQIGIKEPIEGKEAIDALEKQISNIFTQASTIPPLNIDITPFTDKIQAAVDFFNGLLKLLGMDPKVFVSHERMEQLNEEYGDSQIRPTSLSKQQSIQNRLGPEKAQLYGKTLTRRAQIAGNINSLLQQISEEQSTNGIVSQKALDDLEFQGKLLKNADAVLDDIEHEATIWGEISNAYEGSNITKTDVINKFHEAKLLAEKLAQEKKEYQKAYEYYLSLGSEVYSSDVDVPDVERNPIEYQAYNAAIKELQRRQKEAERQEQILAEELQNEAEAQARAVEMAQERKEYAKERSKQDKETKKYDTEQRKEFLEEKKNPGKPYDASDNTPGYNKMMEETERINAKKAQEEVERQEKILADELLNESEAQAKAAEMAQERKNLAEAIEKKHQQWATDARQYLIKAEANAKRIHDLAQKNIQSSTTEPVTEPTEEPIVETKSDPEAERQEKILADELLNESEAQARAVEMAQERKDLAEAIEKKHQQWAADAQQYLDKAEANAKRMHDLAQKNIQPSKASSTTEPIVEPTAEPVTESVTPTKIDSSVITQSSEAADKANISYEEATASLEVYKETLDQMVSNGASTDEINEMWPMPVLGSDYLDAWVEAYEKAQQLEEAQSQGSENATEGLNTATEAANNYSDAMDTASEKELGTNGTEETIQAIVNTETEVGVLASNVDEASTHTFGDMGATYASQQIDTATSSVNSFINAINNIPTEKTVTINVSQMGSLNGPIQGTNQLHGTAKFSFGRALAQGDMGAAKTETALVGELGPEMRVRGSKWELLGESGPEFRTIRKGDIIFNQQQTADLLSSGRTRTRGQAFGYGTGGSAYADPNRRGLSYTDTSTGSFSSPKVGPRHGGTQGSYNSKNNSSSNNNVSRAAEHVSGAADDVKEETKSALEDIKKKWSNIIDFIEVKVEHLEKLFDRAVTKAERTDFTRKTRNSEYNKALKQLDFNESYQKKVKDYYFKRADKIASEGLKELSSDDKAQAEIKKAIKLYKDHGDLSIMQFDSEDAKAVVDEWVKWFDKAEDAQDKLFDMDQERVELRKSQAELVVNEAQSKIDHLDARNQKIQAAIDMREKMGGAASQAQYDRINRNIKEEIKYTNKQIETLKKSQKLVQEHSEDWYNYQQQIDEFELSVQSLTYSMLENASAVSQLNKQFAELKLQRLDWLDEILDAKIEASDTAAEKNKYVRQKTDNIGARIDTNKELVQANKDTIKNFAGELKTAVNTVVKNVNKNEKIRANYDKAVAEAKEHGADINKTKYGNIDLTNRKALKNKDGTISTVLGTSAEYNGVEIAYSPLLQTKKGAKELDQKIIDQYINELLKKVGENWTTEDLLKLDQKGLKIGKQKISGLIADVGPTARQTAENMHYVDAARYAKKGLKDTISKSHSGLVKSIRNAADGKNRIPDDLMQQLDAEIDKNPKDVEGLENVQNQALKYNNAILVYEENKHAYELSKITAKTNAEANAEQIKANIEAERDEKIQKAQQANSLAQYMYQNTQGRNVKYTASLGRAEAKSLKKQYKAYVGSTKDQEKELNKTGKDIQSSIAKQKSDKKIEKNKEYRQVLKRTEDAVKAKKKVDVKDIKLIEEYNKDLAIDLYQWNAQVDDVENARHEQSLQYAMMSSRLAEITNENFARQTQVSENRMAQNDADMEIATSAAEKNKLLEANNSELDHQDAINAAKTAEWLKKRNEKKSDVEALGNALLESGNIPEKYVKAIKEALRCCDAGETIGEGTMEDIAEGVDKKYITPEFFEACVDYNQANEQYRQAKYTQELEAARNKKQKAQNALKMVQNIVTEGQNLRNWRSTWGAKGDKMGYDRNNKNKTAFNRDYAEAFGHYTHEEDIEDDIHNTYLDLYQYQIDYEEAVRTFNEQVAKGALQPGMDEWFEAQQVIEDARKGIDDTTLALKELRNELRQLRWLQFDDLMASMQRVNDEIAHFITMLSNEMMFDEFNRGDMTKYGLATATLHNEARQINLGEALRYQQELDELNAQVASGILDWTDKNVITRQRQLTDSIREHVEAVETEKQALIDLVRQGYEAQLSALNKTISKYKELKDQEKEAYDYQKRIAEQTKNINNIQKQLAAFESNTSEEAVATIQRLQKELKTAKQERSDFQYERYLSDVQAMLDDLSSNFQEWIEYYMRDRDQVLRDMINEINGVSQDLGLDINTAADNAQIALDTIRNSEVNLFEGQNSTLSTLSTNLQTSITETGTTSDKVLNDIADDHKKIISEQKEIEQKTYEQDIEIANEIGKDALDIKGSIGNAAGAIVQAIEDKEEEITWTVDEDANDYTWGTVDPEHLNGALLNAGDGTLYDPATGIHYSDNGQIIPTAEQLKEIGHKLAEPNGSNLNGAVLNDGKGGTYDPTPKTEKKTDLPKEETPKTEPKKETKKDSSNDGKIEIGDKVKFVSDGVYYNSSYGDPPTGTKKRGKNVYVVKKSPKTPYPYLISTTKKEKDGLGWVSKAQLANFVMGTKFAPNGPAWTQERGSEVIYRKSDGAMLTPLGQGDMVFSHAMSENLWNLAKMNIPDMIEKALTQPVVTNKQEVAISPQTNIHMNVTLPNVRNYEEFRQAILNDKQFQNGIQEMTLGAAMGRNSLSKYKYM